MCSHQRAPAQRVPSLGASSELCHRNDQKCTTAEQDFSGVVPFVARDPTALRKKVLQESNKANAASDVPGRARRIGLGWMRAPTNGTGSRRQMSIVGSGCGPRLVESKPVSVPEEIRRPCAFMSDRGLPMLLHCSPWLMSLLRNAGIG
jgi:hypothetical protein